MGDSALLPCPFCGKVPKIKFPDADGGCTILHICKFVFNPTFATPEDAAKAWNDRIGYGPIQASIDNLWGDLKREC